MITRSAGWDNLIDLYPTILHLMLCSLHIPRLRARLYPWAHGLVRDSRVGSLMLSSKSAQAPGPRNYPLESHTLDGVPTTRRNTNFPFWNPRSIGSRNRRPICAWIVARNRCRIQISASSAFDGCGDGWLVFDCVCSACSCSPIPMRTASQSMNTCPSSSVWAVTRRMAALPWWASV